MGSQKIRHDWACTHSIAYKPLVYNITSYQIVCEWIPKICLIILSLFYHYYAVPQWHPTPVLLPGKSHGRRSLVGCSPWSHEESDTYWATSRSLFTFMHWRRKWQPIPVFLPGESQGRRSLVGCVYGVTQSRTWLKQLSSSSSSMLCHKELPSVQVLSHLNKLRSQQCSTL